MKTALLLYPHQLFEAKVLPQADTVFLVEEPLFFGTDQELPHNFHRQKLVLHRASMRRYEEEVLWPAGYGVEYVEFHHLIESGDILAKLKHFDRVILFEPVHEVLLKRLQKTTHDMPGSPVLEVVSTPNFYLKRNEVISYFTDKKNHTFAEFYQWQRERFNILIDSSYQPVGGQWMLDDGNRTKVPAGEQLPTFEVFGDNKHVKEAREYVDKYFPDNQSDDSDFPWPTSHTEAAAWLDNFVETRIDNYVQYQDAIDGNAVWLYHSALASSLNIGLLSPGQIIARVMERHQKRQIELASLETFVRQIIGWREYARAIYEAKPASMQTTNVFKHQRHMTADWRNGTTGIPPLDDVIKKVGQRAYVHHAERQLVLGTLMLLSEINPEEVNKWFMELFVDTYEWMPTPNIQGLMQLGEAGGMKEATYPVASEYILSMSNYSRGDWCDTWDGLYWRFIDKHQEVLAKHPHLSHAVRDLPKLDPAKQRIIGYRADDFLNTKTKVLITAQKQSNCKALQ